MAVSSTTNTVYLLGNGSTVVFPYPYYFTSQTDLKVHLYDNIAGGIQPQTLGLNYSIVGTPNSQGLYTQGANVQFTSSVVNTSYVVIDRQLLQEQNFNILQTGVISSTGVVNEFDYLTLIVQALQDQLHRTAKLPDGFGAIPAFNPALPSTVNLLSNAGFLLAINSGASGFQIISPAQAVGGTAVTASSIVGIMSVAQGGTGVATSPTVNGVAFGLTASTLGYTGAGSANQVLTQTLTGPVFQNLVIGSSAVAAGSLIGVVPISSGGTGNGSPPPLWSVVLGSNATSYSYVPPGPAGQVLTANGSSAPSYQPVTAVQSGVVSIALGGTGQVTALAGFNALSPITTGGQLMVGSGTNNVIAIGAGSSGTVLQSFGAGQVPGWVSATSGLQYTANQYGMVVSGSSNTQLNVIAPNSSTSLVLVSQGTGANPAWLPAPTPMISSGDMIAGSSTLGTPTRVQGNSSAFMGYLTQTASGGVIAQPVWFQPVGINAKIFNVLGGGPYVPSPNVKGAKVTIIGGGGSGGSCATSAASSGAAGGAGSGGTVIKYLSGSSLLGIASFPFIIGSGGPASASGGNNGLAGSSTIFGSSILPQALVAGGGNFGAAGGAINLGSLDGGGGFGGTATGGDYNMVGNNGGSGITYGTAGVTGVQAGFGAGSFMSGQVWNAVNSNIGGANANGYGGGGAGGQNLNNGGAQIGGTGFQGIVIVEEFM